MKTIGKIHKHSLLFINVGIITLLSALFLQDTGISQEQPYQHLAGSPLSASETLRDGHWQWLSEVAMQRRLSNEELQSIYRAPALSESWWSQHLSAEHIQNTLQQNMRGPYREHAAVLALHLIQLCKKYQFDPAMILALIQAESSFRTDVRSFVGAIGLMQLLPSTAQYIADKSKNNLYRGADDLINPFMNLSLGVAYLAYLRKQFQPAEQYLAAYNMGPKAVRQMVAKNEFYVGEGVEKYLTDIQGSVTNIQRQLAVNSPLAWD